MLAFVPATLALLATLLAGGVPAFAGDEPGTPPSEPGMSDPSEPGMADPDAPAMGDDAADPDDDDSDASVSLIEKVKKAIEKGVAWLKKAQLADGSWGQIGGGTPYGGGQGQGYPHPAGPTALALYTLLKCKVPVDDPVVKKGFKYLRDKYKIPGGAYETSMVLLAVTAVADPFKRSKASIGAEDKVKLTGEWRAWAIALKESLMKKRDKAKTLGWRYNVEVPGLTMATLKDGNEDMSSTQLAALALLACERCSIKSENKFWHDLITFCQKQQQDDGPAWDRAVYDKAPKGKPAPSPGGSDPDKERYGPSKPNEPAKDRARGFSYIKTASEADERNPTGGMTACGICNIQMARYILGKPGRGGEAWAKRDQAAILQSVYDGCAWLDANWNPAHNPGKQTTNIYYIYYLYCMERAFDLIGNQLLGKHNWYIELAEQLTGIQKDNGSWNSKTTLKPEEVLDTCFALLVLKRSTKGGIPYGSVTQPGDAPPEDNR
jgi:hypothetical protein